MIDYKIHLRNLKPFWGSKEYNARRKRFYDNLVVDKDATKFSSKFELRSTALTLYNSLLGVGLAAFTGGLVIKLFSEN